MKTAFGGGGGDGGTDAEERYSILSAREEVDGLTGLGGGAELVV